MSGVCGYQRRCGDPECPFSVCDGCPISELMDERGIGTREELMEVLDEMYGGRGAGMRILDMRGKRPLDARLIVRCGFCGKSAEFAACLIQSPDGKSHVCDECVGVMAEAVSQAMGGSDGWPDPPRTPLTYLRSATCTR